MCNQAGITFVRDALTEPDVKGKRVLEVGAYDVNGSTRPYLKSFAPSEYIGVDIEDGPGVDIVCNAETLVERFGPQSFDVVLTTEMLEHVRDWRRVISNLKGVLRPGGVLVITTRSKGFPIHAYPYDFWRYELDDMRTIFADFDDVTVSPDAPEAGVFVRAIKSTRTEPDLAPIELYSMIRRRRTLDVSNAEVKALKAAWIAWNKVKGLIPTTMKQSLLDRLSRPAG
ncbi:bifunctional 2-polyprenyl-6-hydroxyphenol methylase/3-demethylubiquinol 3-O-methyltransferase UbiG [Nostocoides sp. HKS02]|uniref:class I SAM-dependent methyltransferase n=1 Tax=Nostocoides sp. HKS02 TaxID=1813880 RepID=UPI0012B4DC72|nr:class I SAM-dependent methyltransferase [Tetrasphaera sp. HKS02]QGN57952.1 methyltransferase domain-containing protein [Tetrasphaera sp. HKS02]